MGTVYAVSFGTSDAWMLAAIGVILVVLSFLAAAEVAFTRVTRHKAAALAESGSHQARRLVRLVEHPERVINPILLTVSALQTLQAILTGIVADRMFGVGGVVAAGFLNLVVFFVLAESAPKTFALQHPERVALASARPLAALVRFPPLRLLSKALIGLANVVVPGRGLKQGPFVSEKELLAMAEVAAAEEVIEHEEKELIESVIEFGDTVAREVMVPRPDMVTVPASASISDAIDVTIRHGYSRLPVVGAGIDDIVGIAYAKDLMRAEREGRGEARVATRARPAHFVPETKQVRALMREMQTGRFHMVVLVDEYGGTAGIVTLEDLIEELVGDIVDEYDVEAAEVEPIGDGEFRVRGTLPIDDLAELLGRDLPDEDWDTAGGFVFGLLGHVPIAGEVADHDGWRFTVERVDRRRIAAVRVERVPGWVEPDRDEDEG